MITKTKNAQCRLTEEEYDELARFAEEKDVRVSDVVRWAVQDYMRAHKMLDRENDIRGDTEEVDE